ncbi:MAG: hypothetical protein BJ554DRAFT_6650 [Olpidium bornovanus]|uniref:Uncharacterized protein n=1 Tax=Olpidium bornovanus TaxID=278681 RepID=A0A8H7ZXC4_9FUNG|nr:MAG: hypothetical protein BJ554DRAFT_6650 [Olpidium bornovanus]
MNRASGWKRTRSWPHTGTCCRRSRGTRGRSATPRRASEGTSRPTNGSAP